MRREAAQRDASCQRSSLRDAGTSGYGQEMQPRQLSEVENDRMVRLQEIQMFFLTQRPSKKNRQMLLISQHDLARLEVRRKSEAVSTSGMLQ